MAIVTPPLWSVQEIRQWYTDTHGPLPATSIERSHTSSEVSWLSSHEALWPVIARAQRHGWLPLVGTYDWLGLADGDPRKVGAIYFAADMWALHAENRQLAKIEAAQTVSQAADWRAIGKYARDRDQFTAANPWARRQVVA